MFKKLTFQVVVVICDYVYESVSNFMPLTSNCGLEIPVFSLSVRKYDTAFYIEELYGHSKCWFGENSNLSHTELQKLLYLVISAILFSKSQP